MRGRERGSEGIKGELDQDSRKIVSGSTLALFDRGIMQGMKLFACSLLLLAALGQQTIAPAYDQPYRPQYHFSPREHWTNDPNGLVYFDGEYHLFFQYNPFGDKWGHMSWGHAVSTDTVHWQQLPVALPEENGVMIFTGSTVIDEHNTSGFCTGGKPCMVAIYTGYTAKSGSKPSLQTQNIAYSNDRGRTWTKYKGNPVLDLHMSEFRDPKVLWSQMSKQWVMVVSLPDDHKVRIYGSADLKQWHPISEFGPAGATSGQWECPELFELPVEGQNQTRWVMKIGLNPGSLQGGSGEQYFVGQFDGTRFVNENPPSQTLWTDYGKDCYCALTFNGLPKSQPMAMIGWMSNWQYAADLPTSPWRGQMTAPRELGLRRTPEGLRLVQNPTRLLQQLRMRHEQAEGADLANLNGKLAQSHATVGHTFEVEAALDTSEAQELGVQLQDKNGGVTLIGYNRATGKLFVDRTRSGRVDFSKDFPARTEAPLKLTGNTLQLHLLVDRNSLEVFADNGRIAMTNLIFPAQGEIEVEAYAQNSKAKHARLNIWELKSTHTTN
jgi:fructan beta-fructosidase